MLKVTYIVNSIIPATPSNWIYVMLFFPPEGFRGYKQQDNAINEQTADSHKWFTNGIKRPWMGNLQRTIRKSSLTKTDEGREWILPLAF